MSHIPAVIQDFQSEHGPGGDHSTVTARAPDDADTHENMERVCPEPLKLPGCISAVFTRYGVGLCDTGYLACAQHLTNDLQLKKPFTVELQNRDRRAVISSQEPPVLLHCPPGVLPAVMSAKQFTGWVGIELDNVTSATTVVLHVESAPHGIKVLVGEHLSKAGPVAKHCSFRVPVSERVYGVSAFNGRWRSDLTAVELVPCTRYSLCSTHDTLNLFCACSALTSVC